MHPAVILLVFGYGLALPALAKLRVVIAQHHRLAFVAHQVGMTVATTGWSIRGRWIIALIHVVWIVIARVWFGLDRDAPAVPPRRRGGRNG